MRESYRGARNLKSCKGDEKKDSHKKVSGRKKKGPLHIIISMYNMYDTK